MRPLSATECITPAIERTRLVLFSPFRMGRSWKLSATAYLTVMGVLFVPFPLIYLAFVPAAYRSGGKIMAIAVVALILFATAFFTWIFHLCSRLQFAYFDIVVNRGEFVAPAWRKYGPQALAWTGVKILAGTALTLVCAVPLTAYVRHLMPLFRSMSSLTPGQPPPPEFMTAMAGFYAGYFLFLLVFGAVYLVGSIFANFLIPSLALENTGLREAFRRMIELIRREPGEFAIFVLLKTGLGIAAHIGAIILWEIAFLLCSLLLGIVVFFFGFLIHLAGVPTTVLTALGIFLAIVWYLFATTYSLMLAIGPAWTFLDAFALYFLGGRYPMLGDLLDRSTPAPQVTQTYSSPYRAFPVPPTDTVG
jgi:hypothetical protein